MTGVIVIDGITEIKGKKAGEEKALRFNVLYKPSSKGSHEFIAIPGFRWLSGSIFPPMSCIRGRWFPVLTLGEETARDLYEELTKELRSKGMLDNYLLNGIDTAVAALHDRQKVCRDFPTSVGFM